MKLFVLLFAMLFVLGACSNGGGEASNKATVGPDWRPEEVALACPSRDCPTGVGILILINGDEASRCTASLVQRDLILTNAHCDEDRPFTRGYFIASRPGGRGTVIRSVTTKTFRMIGNTSGPERDIALFRLASPITEISPLNISRRIPARMRELAAYVIDEAGWLTNFRSFNLNKKVCTTIDRMVLLDGGVADKKVGLGLFNCAVLPGNSGGPLFSEDSTDIQVLVNTHWDQTGKKGEYIRGLFMEMPDYMKKPFGMGERLHCLPIPGFADAAESCGQMSFEENLSLPFRAEVQRSIAKWYSQERLDAAAEWVLFPLSAEIRFDDVVAYGLALVPLPMCRYDGADHQQISYPIFRLGLIESGLAGSETVEERTFEGRFQSDAGSLVAGTIDTVPGYRVTFVGEGENFLRQHPTSTMTGMTECPANAREIAEQLSNEEFDRMLKVAEAQMNSVTAGGPLGAGIKGRF